MQHLQYLNMTIYMDNFYTSTTLLNKLLMKGIYDCDTVRSNQKVLPVIFSRTNTLKSMLLQMLRKMTCHSTHGWTPSLWLFHPTTMIQPMSVLLILNRLATTGSGPGAQGVGRRIKLTWRVKNFQGSKGVVIPLTGVGTPLRIKVCFGHINFMYWQVQHRHDYNTVFCTQFLN